MLRDDRIIVGLDQLNFLIGQEIKLNCEGPIVFKNDVVLGYKWQNLQIHVIELEYLNSEAKPLNVPCVHDWVTDLIQDCKMARHFPSLKRKC